MRQDTFHQLLVSFPHIRKENEAGDGIIDGGQPGRGSLLVEALQRAKPHVIRGFLSSTMQAGQFKVAQRQL